jgi:tRNA uridine 5-carboxymethylaminomethyl modification enzyme
MRREYDVVVIGGGHAGCEAALAAARLGSETLLVTSDRSTLARMSCNPAVGGLAKGQAVREIDALGGWMGLVADRTGIQFKVLNASRGPAVRGLRCQSDKSLYSKEMSRIVASAARLTVATGTACGFRVEGEKVTGVGMEDGSVVPCRATVVTGGTFLRGLVHVGEERRESGRWEEPASKGLSAAIAGLGFRMGRMKTGTPPRVAGGSVDRTAMERAAGDAEPVPFSFRSRCERFPVLPQVDCWITYTNPAVHGLIVEALPHSPLYSGRIVGRGPRYCPSIEDKVVRFAGKERHQIFVEPEGLATDWLYLNGLSMSLPATIQERVVRGIPGLEKAEIVRPAYAVEYDVILAEQLRDTLESRGVRGLFFAGQVNGTSGYEEAAGQGLVAGANAALQALGREQELLLGREEAYLGVMIDDLVTLGTDEPYRLLSSRAEHRLLLGADTVYARLTPKAVELGLVSPAEGDLLLAREARLERVKGAFRSTRLTPGRETQEALGRLGIALAEQVSLAGLVRRPEVEVEELRAWAASLLQASAAEELLALDGDELARVRDDLRYEGVLHRERETIDRLSRSEGRRIPDDFTYRGLPGLSLEAVEKLERHRPRTIGQASRIPGVPPAAVTLLLAQAVARERRGQER